MFLCRPLLAEKVLSPYGCNGCIELRYCINMFSGRFLCISALREIPLSRLRNRQNLTPALPRLALLLMTAITMLLGACFGTKTAELSEPSGSDEFALTIIARTASGAPDDFGVDPGDLAVGAKVSVENIEFPEVVAASGTTDESGRLVVMVRRGNYQVWVKLETHDPKCHWFAGEQVEVTNKNTNVSVDDLWVLCE